MTTQPVGDNRRSVWPSGADDRQRARIATVVLVLMLLAAAIAVRLFWMQVVAAGSVRGNAPGAGPASTVHSVEDTAVRGVIVDRNGELLAADRFVYRVALAPKDIPEKRWQELAQALEEIIGVPAGQTLGVLAQNADRSHAVLADELSMARGHALIAAKRAGLADDNDLLYQVYPTAIPRRFYPQRQLACHVLGLVNRERVSKFGVESYYDRFLREDGVSLPQGQWQPPDALPADVLRYIPPGESKALVLTIDRAIQWIIEDELQKALGLYRAKAGTIIVMDPKTGAVLGLANAPAYDPNQFSAYYRENPEALINPAVSLQYEPGSVYKLITYAAALDAGVIKPMSVFTDTGIIAIGGRLILNSSRTAVGRVTAADALAQSLNVVTAQVAELLGAGQFYGYVQRFGFGETTDIDLADEVAGLVKKPGDLYWSLADLGANSFGQGLAVTPIQLVTAVAAIANGGQLMRPHVVQARIDDGRVLLTQPTAVRRSIKPETATTMTEMMVHTVEFGNHAARIPGYRVAGKSGTAQIPTSTGYTELETIVSFVGFAPADDPRFVVLVKMDRPDPNISPWAAYTAAPVFSRVVYRLLNHLDILPDEQRLAQIE